MRLRVTCVCVKHNQINRSMSNTTSRSGEKMASEGEHASRREASSYVTQSPITRLDRPLIPDIITFAKTCLIGIVRVPVRDLFHSAIAVTREYHLSAQISNQSINHPDLSHLSGCCSRRQ